MAAEAHKALVRRFMEEVFNRGNLAVVDGVRGATEPGFTLSPFGRAAAPVIGGKGDRLRGFPRSPAPGGLPPVLGRFHR
jgi:hypothetical protein